MRTRKNNLKAVSPDRLTELQGYTSGNFGIDGSREYLEARKYIGFHVVSMSENNKGTDIVWGRKDKRG